MCQAIREMREEAEARGFKRGFKEGFEETLSWLADFVKSGVITLEQALEKAKMTEAEFVAKTGLKS